MSIEIVDARASAAAAVRWFGTAAPKPAFSRSRRDRCHPGYFQVDRTRWLDLLVDPTKSTVVRTSGDPGRLDLAAALRRGTRA
jgi:hypothetical protein